MANYDIAIKEINPDAQFYITGDGEESLDNIQWLEGTTPIAKADIIAKDAEVKARDAHKIPREYEYPPKREQLDMMFHDKVDGTTTWQDAIQAIKDANPKA